MKIEFSKATFWRYSAALLVTFGALTNLFVLVFSESRSSFRVAKENTEIIDFQAQRYRIKDRAKYSSHYCRKIGGLSAQCIFSNVRFQNNTLVYYENPENRVTFINQATKYDFPKNFVGLRSGDNLDYLKIVKVQTPVPNDAVYFEHPVAYLLSSLWSKNFGHWLIDDLFASFANMLDLGVRVAEIPYVIKAGCMTNHYAGTNDYKRCSGFWKNALKLFTTAAPVYLDDNPYIENSENYKNNEKFSNLYQSTGIYFQNVVMGQQLNYIVRGTNKMSTHWQYFINDMLYRLDAKSLKPSEQQITILQKHGKRRVIENFDEIVAVAKEFGHKVNVMDPSTLSVEEQIIKMRKTTVLITVPGGISFIAGFLQPPSVALMTDIWNYRSNQSIPLEDHVWEALGAFNFYRYEYQINEAIFPQGYNNYSNLPVQMRAEMKLPLEGFIDPTTVSEENKYNMMRNYGNIRMDLNRFRTAVGELLRIADVNFNLSK